MKEKTTNKVNVAKVLASIIGSRDVIDDLRDSVAQVDVKTVELDFSEVDFVSRSAAHALLSMKEDFKRKLVGKKEVTFTNVNSSIKEMLRIVAANKALPKEKPDFQAERVDISHLSEKTQVCS